METSTAGMDGKWRGSSRNGFKPGDSVRYSVTASGVQISKAEKSALDDPFATFGEWSSEADEKAYGLHWVAIISTAKNEQLSSDIEIDPSSKSGLSATSIIRIEKIATIERERFYKITGSISLKEKRAVKAATFKILI